MSLPLTMALIVKLLFWMAALLVCVRTSMRHSDELEAGMRRWSAALLLGALTGSKLFFVLAHPDLIGAWSGEGDQMLWWISGNSAIGALVGGFLAVRLSEGAERARGLADALAMPVASVLLVLSVGAFFWALRGSGYGSPTDFPLGVNFGDGVSRHPVMLYEAAFLGFVIWMQHHRQTFSGWRGGLGSLLLLGYCLFTLAVGYLKPPFGVPLLLEVIEPAGYLYAGILTADQCVSALVIILLIPRLSRLSSSDGKVDSAV